jgi:hypothetical protein
LRTWRRTSLRPPGGHRTDLYAGRASTRRLGHPDDPRGADSVSGGAHGGYGHLRRRRHDGQRHFASDGRYNRRCCSVRDPRLLGRDHGSWYFHASATNLLGRPERVRRGGFASQPAARRARDAWLASTEADRTAQGWTVERWLRYWLSTRTRLRPTTLLHYTRDVEQALIPRLGQLRLADLDARVLRATFAEIARTTNRRGRPQSPSALQHLRTTLRAALNFAVREGLLECNPARHIEIRGYQRPYAQVWTDARIEQWQATGERPAVAVWTAEHPATFLAATAEDSLFALWWLIALRGLRRGEACGLRWSEVDLDHNLLFICRAPHPCRLPGRRRRP